MLAMPTIAFADTYYTVKSGDSLWKIANSFSVSIDQIKNLNSLKSDLLQPGQSLLVKKSTDQRPASAEIAETSRGTSRPDTIISYAKKYIGVPYRGGGQTPRGFDCSGYVQYVFKNFGINMPRTAAEQYSAGRKVSRQEAEPGDIIAFRTGKYISHSGIYLGGGKFISSTSSRGVIITSIQDPYWSDHFLGFSRIIE
ncbi:MAG: glycoside hydrolase [Peptococcaceae bacterium BICA1-7]|nr:MAG: glycoside hydrolase [Peptococcaceae bacterium BICA1-7]HBV97453.1 glycoside hydrolase [Desulfotomaculum sp.]